MQITVAPSVSREALVAAARDIVGPGVAYELRTDVRMGKLVLTTDGVAAPAEPLALDRDNWPTAEFVDGMYVVGWGTL